eukprot:TRINITY_DN391_c0_g1_i4.p1 TRINITY_DN391_c0_g1~~TRINITY_DN391_c0_g1_i4.p1  ORF type:complete len:591 (+),score=108.12 TRINITY_DN391_c0_g1_i4:243-2015(+)
MAQGILFALFPIIFGTSFNNISVCFDINNQTLINSTFSNITLDVSTQVIQMVVLGGLVGISNAMYTILFIGAAYWIAMEIKKKIFNAILHRKVSFFDDNDGGALISQLSNDVTNIENGFGDKLAPVFGNICQFVTGIVVALATNWRLGLVLLATTPFMIVVTGSCGFGVKKCSLKEAKILEESTGVVSSSLEGVRTVYSFSMKEHLQERNDQLLSKSVNVGRAKGKYTGLLLGGNYFYSFATDALGFWYGTELLKKGQIKPGDILTTFFAIRISLMGIAIMAQNLPDVQNGAAFASKAIHFIKDLVNVQTDEGEAKPPVDGHVTFSKVKPGHVVALVGESGSGKSTIVNLLLRFYEAASGEILLDGVNIKEIDMNYLRNQIALVSQEPILFAGTIKENIMYGKPGITEDVVISAAKKANAHKFIMDLPNGYDTLIGERGASLSGGQKQRIAIARALVRDTKVLLLDEATSALDAESEKLVHKALTKLMKNRTSFVVAHRLTTIKNADLICVLVRGKIVEKGTHEELLKKKGFYAQLIRHQLMKEDEKNKKNKKTEILSSSTPESKSSGDDDNHSIEDTVKNLASVVDLDN